MSEQVLVVKSDIIPTGVWYKPGELLNNINLNDLVYMLRLRDTVENSPEYKQIIPYVLIIQDNKIVSYQRSDKGGEERLHNKISIGFGGHINEKDCNVNILYTKLDGKIDIRNYAQLACIKRELKEELGLDVVTTDHIALEKIGCIQDDSDEVGKVHLGIVYVLHIEDHVKLTPSDEICNIVFNPISDLITLSEEDSINLESWSKLALQLYKSITEKK